MINTKLKELPVNERIKLVEELWDSIASDQKALQFTDEQKAELDRRLDAYAADGSQGRLATESITDIRQQAATLEVRLRPKAEQDSSDAAAYRIIIVSISRSGFLFLVHHLERPILKWVKWKYKKQDSSFKRVQRCIKRVKSWYPELFIHWTLLRAN